MADVGSCMRKLTKDTVGERPSSSMPPLMGISTPPTPSLLPAACGSLTSRKAMWQYALSSRPRPVVLKLWGYQDLLGTCLKGHFQVLLLGF